MIYQKILRISGILPSKQNCSSQYIGVVSGLSMFREINVYVCVRERERERGERKTINASTLKNTTHRPSKKEKESVNVNNNNNNKVVFHVLFRLMNLFFFSFNFAR